MQSITPAATSIRDALATLTARLEWDEVEARPDGYYFPAWRTVRDRLDTAFGPEGWSFEHAASSSARGDGGWTATFTGQLTITWYDETTQAMRTLTRPGCASSTHPNTPGDALKGARSKALTNATNLLGLGDELADKRYVGYIKAMRDLSTAQPREIRLRLTERARAWWYADHNDLPPSTDREAGRRIVEGYCAAYDTTLDELLSADALMRAFVMRRVGDAHLARL